MRLIVLVSLATTITVATAQLCTPAQQDQIVALWRAAAQTSACSKYASAGSTWFSWPCSAKSCTATLKDLAYKVPSCVIGTENERTRILYGISICTGTAVSTRTPTPASPPATRPPSTATPPSVSDEETPAPARTTDDEATSTTCTLTEIYDMMELYVNAATSSNCKAYSTIAPHEINIYAPCSSSCVVVDVNKLADSLPDCFYAWERVNKKKEVKTALNNCKPMSGRRAFLGDATEKYFTLLVKSQDPIKAGTESPALVSVKSSASMTDPSGRFAGDDCPGTGSQCVDGLRTRGDNQLNATSLRVL